MIKVPPHFQKEKTLLESSLTSFQMSLDLQPGACPGPSPSFFPPGLSHLLSSSQQEACERSLAEMESSHQQVMEELQRHHQRELERLRQEKERLLAEEAAATAAGRSKQQAVPLLSWFPAVSPQCLLPGASHPIIWSHAVDCTGLRLVLLGAQALVLLAPVALVEMGW